MLWNCSVVNWHEVAETLKMVGYVQDTTAKKLHRYSEYGSCEQLLSLFCLFCFCFTVVIFLLLFFFFFVEGGIPLAYVCICLLRVYRIVVLM